MMGTILDLSSIKRDFIQGPKTLNILRGIDLTVEAGESVALVGSSGAGKSTLLQIAGLLDHPTSGGHSIAGRSMGGLNEKERSTIRSNDLGFVYQFHHLLSDFTALENVAIALRIQGVSPKKSNERAGEYLSHMGLADRLSHRPSELSGGEQQRVAIARALVTKPKLLLADEPTGNLDEATSEKVFSLLLEMVKRDGLSAVIATHDKSLAARLDRIVYLHDGLLQNA